CRVGLGLSVGLLQIEDQRHQRFGDKTSAEDAEMTALIRTAAEGIGQVLIHQVINSSVARAAAMKARINSGSLTPDARSTPEETSTPRARLMWTASATLPA